jgi:hypothetical protein
MYELASVARNQGRTFNNMEYQVSDGTLIIRDNAQRAVWKGRPEGYALCWASSIPGSEHGLALYDYYRPRKRSGPFQNLVRVQADGSIIWRASLPTGDDTYTAAEMDGEKLVAWSWQCYRVQIDIETGRILEQTFTK